MPLAGAAMDCTCVLQPKPHDLITKHHEVLIHGQWPCWVLESSASPPLHQAEDSRISCRRSRKHDPQRLCRHRRWQWNLGTGNQNLPPLPPWRPHRQCGWFQPSRRIITTLQLDRSADVGGAGYHVDLIRRAGRQCVVLPNPHTAADFVVKQAYIAIARSGVGNGLISTRRLGHIIGYEVFESASTRNFPRSVTAIPLEPTTPQQPDCWPRTNSAKCFGNVGNCQHLRPRRSTARVPANPAHSQAESWKTYMASVTFTVTAPTNCGFHWRLERSLIACSSMVSTQVCSTTGSRSKLVPTKPNYYFRGR